MIRSGFRNIFYALVLTVFASTAAAQTSGTNFSNTDRNSFTRRFQEHALIATDPASTTGDVVTSDTMPINVTNWVAGYTLPTVTTTSLNGARTLKYYYTEASGSAAKLTIKVTGTDVFGNPGASETVPLVTTSSANGKIAFVPHPVPTITVMSATSLSNADRLDIHTFDVGLRSNPVASKDILSETWINNYDPTNGTASAEQTNQEGWTFSSRYDPNFSTYKITGGDLTVNPSDELWWEIFTSSTRRIVSGSAVSAPHITLELN